MAGFLNFTTGLAFCFCSDILGVFRSAAKRILKCKVIKFYVVIFHLAHYAIA